jgi:hypothetical protein
MAISFNTFADGKRYRLLWMGTTPIKTEDGVRRPFEPFDASPRWLQGRHGMAHRLVTTDDYALGLAKASSFDLCEHASRRGVSTESHRKADLLGLLLEGIAPVPPFEETGEQPQPAEEGEAVGGFVSMTLDLDAMSRNELREVAAELGLQVGGTKDELKARIEAAHVETFEEE